LCLALEAGKSLCVLGYVVKQELECNEAMQLHVLSLVDHTHPAAAQLLDEAVVRDGLPDHWAEMLGLEVGQVNESVKVGRATKGQFGEKSIMEQNSPALPNCDH
jgi:hypothetical protein